MPNLPDFKSEAYVNRHAPSARHHLSASDAETLSAAELLSLDGHAAQDAFVDLRLGYSETLGSEALRHAIAATYEGMNGANIMRFAGAGEAIFALCNTLFSKADHAVVITPNYQSHETLPAALGSVTAVSLDPEADWALDLDQVADAIRPDTTAIFINYPHNPTGTVLPEAHLQQLITLCRDRDLYLINDEVFRGLPAPGVTEPPAVADAYEKGLSINVLSKSYGLPGLRIGWIATADTRLIARLDAFKHYLSVCTATASEVLATVALRHRAAILSRNQGLVARNTGLWRDFFARNADMIDPVYPQGGCIAYPRYNGPGGVAEFAHRIRSAHGVFVVPASVFASDHGATPKDRFRVGFGRLGLADGLSAFDTALRDMRATAG